MFHLLLFIKTTLCSLKQKKGGKCLFKSRFKPVLLPTKRSFPIKAVFFFSPFSLTNHVSFTIRSAWIMSWSKRLTLFTFNDRCTGELQYAVINPSEKATLWTRYRFSQAYTFFFQQGKYFTAQSDSLLTYIRLYVFSNHG